MEFLGKLRTDSLNDFVSNDWNNCKLSNLWNGLWMKRLERSEAV